jgi:hypothetical protein
MWNAWTMKRIIAAAGIALLGLAPAAAGRSATPSVSIVTSSPLVVAGAHFRSHERVTITAANTTRSVRTTALGAFRASFSPMTVDRCSAVRIVAVGAFGDRAVFARTHVMCAPAMPG